jgi:hypothetical protein
MWVVVCREKPSVELLCDVILLRDRIVEMPAEKLETLQIIVTKMMLYLLTGLSVNFKWRSPAQ